MKQAYISTTVAEEEEEEYLFLRNNSKRHFKIMAKDRIPHPFRIYLKNCETNSLIIVSCILETQSYI